MTGLFVFLFFIFLIALVVGLLFPKKMIFWGNLRKRTRTKIFLYYGIAVLVLLILLGITAPSTSKPVNAETTNTKSTVTRKTSNTTKRLPPTSSKTTTSPHQKRLSNTKSISKINVPSNLVPAKVSANTDGDTIHVTLNGKDETIRMLLIDTPEDVDPVKPVEPYGYTAANYAKKVLPVGKHIYLQEGKPGYARDKYGRLLAYVYITPTDMYNEDVVKKGYARVAYIFPPNTEYLSTLQADQEYAKTHKLGIWSIPNYVMSSGYSLTISCQYAKNHDYSASGCHANNSSSSRSNKSIPSSSNKVSSTTSSGNFASNYTNEALEIVSLSLFDEDVVIKNNGSSNINMSGWKLMSVDGNQTYTFPNGYKLAAGSTVKVESGSHAINHPPSILKWSNAYIWNNKGDIAQLITPQGTPVSTIKQ